MFDFIPIASYTLVYFNVLLLLSIVTLFHSYKYMYFSSDSKLYGQIAGYLLLVFVSLYIGLRPISHVFVDMPAYNEIFERAVAGQEIEIRKDYLFNYFLIFCAKFMNATSFFFVCALIYILPCYWFSKKYCGSFWFFTFFIFVGSLMFWPFGTNGIRNGVATSLFVLALCFYHVKFLMYLIMALAIGTHSSLIIPISAFAISTVLKNPKYYVFIWVASIPLSLVGGSFWESFFSGIGFGDDRVQSYLTEDDRYKDAFASIGFRWDFLFYSSFAVIAGWYFIFKKNITDKFYVQLWGVYMIANAFWILIIRANFSNRFAYLSWFLMAPIIAYPLLRYRVFDKQYQYTGLIISIYFLFTYFMYMRG